MALFSSVIGLGVGIITYILLGFLIGGWMYFWIPFAIPGIILTGFYLYPASEASSSEKNIAYELPLTSARQWLCVSS